MYVRLSKNGVASNKRVHRLVADVFVINEFNYKEVNHIDGDKHNNHYLNLEWCSHSDNIKHAHNKGLISHNERCKRLTDDIIQSIKSLKEQGYSRRQIAIAVGVSRSTVNRKWDTI